MSVSQQATRPTAYPSCPPDCLVLIHGFLDSHSGWSELIEQLQPTSSTIIAPDLRGAGKLRNAGGPYSLEQAVADVVDMIGDFQNVALVGHSMGAQVAELVAQRIPDRTIALVLITPTPLAGNTLPDEVRSTLRNCGGDPDAQRAIRQMFSRRLTKLQLDRLVDPEMMMGGAAVQAYYDAFTGGHPSGNVPCAYDGPMLVISANDDPVIPVQMVTQEREQRFPSAAFARISDSGHWPQMEQPARTAGVIVSFLNVAEVR